MNEFYDSLFTRLAEEHGWTYQFNQLTNEKTGRIVTCYDRKAVGWWRGGKEISLSVSEIVPFMNSTNHTDWPTKAAENKKKK